MNNPMLNKNSNLLRSPSGPPIAKKQRGGTTPGSIKARPRSRPAPPMSNANANANAGMSNATAGRPPPPGEVVDDAIARRRAELRRLQEKARGAITVSNTSNAASSKPNRGPPLSKRSSDIFPTAPKSPSLIPKPKATTAASTRPMTIPDIADMASKTTATTATTTKTTVSNPNLPPSTPGAIPPTPAVGRRLEFPSSQKNTDSNPKTAPTQQRPPPPTRRARSKSPTNSTTTTTTTSPPVNKSTNSASVPRAKSAPPRRPPGPPPGQPSTSSSSTTSASSTKVKARKIKAKRPAPVRPNTMSLLPTIKTKSPKNQEQTVEKVEQKVEQKVQQEVDKPMATSAPPPTSTSTSTTTTATSAPPPTSTSAPPTSTTTTSTSAPPPTSAPTITETPKGQKSIALGGNGGADTPPSSGSSARRQKLHLMRQQALVASSLEPKTNADAPPTAAAAAPPTKMSFYTGGGEPATAAFAKAVTKKSAEPPEIPQLAQVRPTQNNSTQSAAQARLEDAYKKSEQEKMRALIKIKELEDKLSQNAKEQLQKSKKEHQQQKVNIQTILSLAETQGPEAAVNWAKSNADGTFLPTSPAKQASRTGFNTGMGATPRKLPGTSLTVQPTPHRRARMAIRALQARPQAETQNESPEDTERRLIRQFKEAAKFVSYEFSSELATYIVRRPYGIPSNPQGLFDHCRPPTEKPEAYQKRAHVSDKTTIEVAAIVKADNTPLLVFGMAGIRYQTNPASRNVPPEWKHFEDVDAEDRPLGHVTYIDKQANEKEYSLDEILEEALLVREQYCGTLTSTALALPDLKQQQKPPVAESKTPPNEAPKPQQPQKSPKQPQQQQQQQQKQPPPDADIDSGSSDVLVVFLGMVVSFVWNLIYGIFIGTPLKIVRTTIVLVVAFTILQTLHLYLADGYHEWALREFTTSAASTCSSVLASDLSWFSNQHPGIL